MNEKDFFRELNSRDNKDGKMTTTLIFDLIAQDERGESEPPLLYRVRDRLLGAQDKSPRDVLSDNLETIVKKSSEYDRLHLISLLTENEAGRYAIENNFDFFLSSIISWHKCQSAFDKLRKFKDFDPVLDRHMGQIFDSITQEDMLGTCLSLSHVSDASDALINDYIANHKKEYAHEMYLDGIFKKSKNISREELSKKIDIYVDPISQILDELVESENVSYADITFLGKGAYSSVYGIGNKVIKFGAKRANFNFPNHRRVLQPIIRRELSSDDFSSIIEVSERVSTIQKSDEDKEKLYEVYKELRDDGIIWADVRFDNVGILNGPNIPSLRGNPMYVFPEASGADRKIPDEELALLSTGDWVIIDTDHLYRESEFDYTIDSQFQELRPLYKEFKIRYSLEKLKESTSSFDREYHEQEEEK